MESQGAVHPVSDREQNTPLHKCNDKYIQYDPLMAGPEGCRCVILVRWKPPASQALLFLGFRIRTCSMIFRPFTMIHFARPGANTSIIIKVTQNTFRPTPEIKHPHIVPKIASQEITAQKTDQNTDHYQNCLVGDGNDHQNQSGYRNRQFIFFHVKDLHGLSA